MKKTTLVKSIAISLMLFKSVAAFAAEATSGLDINDVSVLFPLDASKKAFPNMTLEGKTPAENLVLTEQFNQALAAAEGLGIKAPNGTASITKLSDWTIFGFRYDPCAPKDHAGPEVLDCMPEIRLIAQPNDQFGPSDTALHLIYSLGDSTPVPGDAALAEIFAAKSKAEALTKLTSSGLPLSVHPLLANAASTNNTEVGEIYANVIRRLAKPENLKKITMMGLAAGSQTHWIFFGGNIEKGVWVQDSIPNLQDDPKKSVELNLNSDKIFFPAPLDILTSTYGFFHREFLVADQYETLKVELHKLADAAVTNRNNSDCLSCHSATSLQVNVRPAQFLEGVTALAPKGITAYPAPALLQRHRLNWNLRAFGYFGILPTLSLHTVNESGRSAAKVNEILGRVNPGRDCSAVQKEVISCFINTSANPSSTGPNTEACLKTCEAASAALPLLPDSTPFPPAPVVEPKPTEPTTPLEPVEPTAPVEPTPAEGSTELSGGRTETKVVPVNRVPVFTNPADGPMVLIRR